VFGKGNGRRRKWEAFLKKGLRRNDLGEGTALHQNGISKKLTERKVQRERGSWGVSKRYHAHLEVEERATKVKDIEKVRADSKESALKSGKKGKITNGGWQGLSMKIADEAGA